MRFVWAVAAFVLAAVMIGAGIAQRTVFQGPKSETVAISVSEDAPYLLIDGAVLNKLGRRPDSSLERWRYRQHRDRDRRAHARAPRNDRQGDHDPEAKVGWTGRGQREPFQQ